MDYRDQALKLYPHVCGRCGRSFTHSNLHELTVHHRDHHHSNNPPDGSNWELLCVYCHDNEHSRQTDYTGVSALAAEDKAPAATSNPFADLKSLLGKVPPKDG
jgi:5-methylcytosine-specific restriction endonuclease McrA